MKRHPHDIIVLTVIVLAVMPVNLIAPTSPRGAETFAAPSVSVTVAWDASPDEVDGYRVYLRQSGSTYSGFQNVGTNRVFRIVGLQRKTTYRCIVTAYRGSLESLPSNELSFRTPFNKSGNVEEL